MWSYGVGNVEYPEETTPVRYGDHQNGRRSTRNYSACHLNYAYQALQQVQWQEHSLLRDSQHTQPGPGIQDGLPAAPLCPM
ncbi:hypothetical protein DPMN_167340 [Dreissena polymorpha]|uniref:Uncharacterized protein n=1 Tax=Dreissena polymorpha TaxID=45954 RepID=A0A9D4IYP8_DREPO|nr:hypothetical protein DPMN_167340 [Dreissena polymorpha]